MKALQLDSNHHQIITCNKNNNFDESNKKIINVNCFVFMMNHFNLLPVWVSYMIPNEFKPVCFFLQIFFVVPKYYKGG